MTLFSSHERLQAIGLKLGGIGRYLEIGVAKGTTFFNVEATQKHAVDPRFRFDPSIRKTFPNEAYHPITSDQFFKQFLGDEAPFDLIFLDGLHTYNQTLRDFLSSQALSHSRTIWLIDDTVPSDAIAADPDLSRVRAARIAEGKEEDETWMGDVFKVIVFINSFCPQYTCLTLEEHGQTIVLPIPQQTAPLQFNSTKEIEHLSYVDALLLRDTLLRPTRFASALELIDQVSNKRA